MARVLTSLSGLSASTFFSMLSHSQGPGRRSSSKEEHAEPVTPALLPSGPSSLFTYPWPNSHMAKLMSRGREVPSALSENPCKIVPNVVPKKASAVESKVIQVDL